MSHELDRETAAYFIIIEAVAEIEGSIGKIEGLSRFTGSDNRYDEICKKLREILKEF